MPIRVLDPNLRAGWEPDTPITDSLVRRFLVNWTTSIEAQGMPLDELEIAVAAGHRPAARELRPEHRGQQLNDAGVLTDIGDYDSPSPVVVRRRDPVDGQGLSARWPDPAPECRAVGRDP
jgi:hypothetical protein